MTKEEIITFAKQKISVFESVIEASKTTEIDKVILRVNKELLDFYSSVLKIINNQ